MGGSCNNIVANGQRTALYQYSGNRSAAFIQFCFNNGTVSRQFRIGFQFFYFCYQKNHFQQIVNALMGMCGNGNHNGIAAPVFRNQFHLGKLLLYVFRIRSRFIHFVDGNNNRYSGRFGMVDCFHGLGHYAVVRRYYQN